MRTNDAAWKNVIAVDPGGTTGVAVWRQGAFEAWHAPADEATKLLHVIIAGPPKPDEVIIEKFTITMRTLKSTRGGSMADIEQVGALKYLCRCYDVSVVEQQPGEAMGFGTDAKLKVMDWWTTSDHSRDATRHLLTRMAKLGAVDLSELAGKLFTNE